MDVFQPPLLYPPLLTKPLNLSEDRQFKNVIEIKKQFRIAMSENTACLMGDTSGKGPNPLEFQATIQRYSDKYSKLKKLADSNKWQPDWNRLPQELKHFQVGSDSRVKKKADSLKRKLPVEKSKSKHKTVKIKKENSDFIDLDSLAKIIAADDEVDNEEGAETNANEDGKKPERNKGSDDEGGNEGDDDEEEVDDDEENIEEENDYIDTYFDNGEDYNDDDGGGGDDDGPVY